MNLPNFLIISAPRTGTTSLYFYLDQHPSIYMSPVKEPGYFILEEGKPMSRPGKINKNLTYTNLESYSKLFDGITNETAFGEATTFYFYKPEAPKRIKETIPNVRLISVLRNPIERAYSDYMLHRGLLEIEPEEDFLTALIAEINQPKEFKNWWDERRYIFAGLYHQHLSRYLEYFQDSDLMIILYEDFKDDTLSVLKSIFRFLEVDEDFEPVTNFQYNTSGVPQNYLLHSLATKPNKLTNLLRRIVPDRYKTFLISVLQNKNYKKPTMDEEARDFLRKQFKDEIDQLQILINRDLSHWLN
jgi:hypothetical protein